jgi:hypothetical protein
MHGQKQLYLTELLLRQNLWAYAYEICYFLHEFLGNIFFASQLLIHTLYMDVRHLKIFENI